MFRIRKERGLRLRVKSSHCSGLLKRKNAAFYSVGVTALGQNVIGKEFLKKKEKKPIIIGISPNSETFSTATAGIKNKNKQTKTLF